MLNLFSNIFGSSNDRILKKMMVHVNAANQLEEELSNKPDDYFQDLKTELKTILIVRSGLYIVNIYL